MSAQNVTYEIGDVVIYINHPDVQTSYIGKVGDVLNVDNMSNKPLIKLRNPNLERGHHQEAYLATPEYIRKLTPLELTML
jgi:hypothetical protein